MPVSEYYKGHGDEVMKKMKREYGSSEGERVFYATAKARDLTRPLKNKKTRVKRVKKSRISRKVSRKRGRYRR